MLAHEILKLHRVGFSVEVISDILGARRDLVRRLIENDERRQEKIKRDLVRRFKREIL
jgi:hypothetical protein